MKSRILIYSLLVTCALVGCSKDYLNLTPISSAVSANFYKTADDIKIAVNGAYGSLQAGGVFSNIYIFGDITSDNSYPVASGTVTDQDEFDRFYIRTTNPYISGCWNDSYKAISRFNTILDRVSAVQMDESLKNRYIGEVKFLRGLVYFHLVRIFGDVPLVLKEITNPDEGYQYGRNSKAEVYAQIEKDLQEAEAVLPVSYSSADIGRATQGAAKALLGKVYLTEKKYSEAAAKLKEVIDLNVYDILSSYGDVFKVSNKNNKESVFDVQFKSGGSGEGNSWPNSFAPQNSGNAVIQFGGDGNNNPTDDMLAAYEAGDLRKNITVATSYVNASGAIVPGNFVKKYYDVPASKNDNGNNIPVIRYADVLLMYAECLNEKGYEPDGIAFSYLNKIRNRAGLAARTSAEINDQQAFRLALEQERRVEFAFEGQRWFDLVRTGRAIPVMNAKKSIMGLTKELTENNLVFPVPQSQIDINKSKITQNSGY